ncbi:MAG: hypothetical protein EB084_10980 [Proteobacteria bacterium]|nr:hypothetical protein [Pseudomonadota bacterium]
MEIVFIVLIAALVVGLFLLWRRSDRPCRQPPVAKPRALRVGDYPPSVHLVSNKPPWTTQPHCVNEFFGYMSTATTTSGDNGYGLNLLGQYCEGTNTNVVKGETSLQTADDVAKFPLTHRAGHPSYYDAQSALGAWGQLQGCSWQDHVRSRAAPLDEAAFDAEAVLLVEGQGGAPVAVSVSGDVRLRGIVVRRGGVLFIGEEAPTTLRVNFILVETGGLLQAGSPDAPPGTSWDFRFQGTLDVVLTHPADGYGTMPVPTSQCSYHFYAPGVDWILPSERSPRADAIFAGFDGTNMCFTNSFAAKAVCAGFNGSYCLCGAATRPVPYAGTWRALEQDGATRTNGEKSLSVGAPLLESAYPLCWARLAPGSGAKGSSALTLHADDVAGLALADVRRVFARGAQVVVTSSSPQYTTVDNISGMSPLYIADKDARPDEDSTPNMKQNRQACDDYRSQFLSPDRGAEVVVVVDVRANGGAFDLVLRDKLRLDHALLPVELVNGDKKVKIEATHHVGVLTHNIVVDGQDVGDKTLQGGAGCNVFSAKMSARAMAQGLANQTSAELMRPAMAFMASDMLEDSDSPHSSGPIGSGGALTYNYTTKGPGGEVGRTCYLAQHDAGKYCLTKEGEEPASAASIRGSWLFGTAGASGCNGIFGGSLMFRYGSSVWMDSVEVVRMGTAPNFGSIGQYAVHFHLFGFAKSFRGYLRSPKYSRDATVRNCSIWRSYSRFVTLHGACEVDVSNNVCCITYGSAMFVEDGTEQLNVFQHNLVSCVFPNCANQFYNPAPIYANVSTDFCTYSLFWLKNNLNVIARNVGCCSHGNCAFIWYVPQSVGCLRGPSAVCFGSERLRLPACGSIDAIALSNQCGLGLKVGPVINNANGALVKFTSGYKCAGSQPCACWVPEDFAYPFTDPATGCVSYTADNSTAPNLLHAENVGYCLPLYHSEFPEAISNGPQTLGIRGCDVNAQGCNWSFQDNRAQSQFMPVNGQNACTDRYISTYSGTRWLEGNFKYQPLTKDERKGAFDGCMLVSVEGQSAYGYVPKIFSGVLTFNLGASSGLWGGVGWSKQGPPMFIECCFLETSDRIAGKIPPTPLGWSMSSAPSSSTSNVKEYPWGSAFFADSNNWDDAHTLSNLYVVFHNFMTNGTLSLCSNVSVFTGAKTFIDTRTTTCLAPSEYTHSAGATLAVAVFDFDFQDVFGSVWDRLGDRCEADWAFNQAQIFSYTDMTYWNVKFGTISQQDVFACKWAKAAVVNKGKFKLPPRGDWPGKPIKYPFMCGGSQDQFGLLSARDPALNGIPWIGGKAINALTAQFATAAAQDVGNRICQALSQTWWNVQSISNDGTIYPLTDFGGAKAPEACKTASEFMDPGSRAGGSHLVLLFLALLLAFVFFLR